MNLIVEHLKSPVGPLTLVCGGDELVTLAFDDHERRALDALESRHDDVVLRDGRVARAVRDAVSAYFEGDLGAVDAIRVRTGGTPFQKSVWHGLRSIPAGETTSYSRLARAIGRPAAVRAVGLANGANPIAIVLPCHRVIGENGSLVGYGGGLPRKRWLLAHEQKHMARSSPFSLTS
jgi:methylated-DNA-[protein]-cysteine S-methyltransferase